MGKVQKIKWETHDEWLSIRHKYIGGSDAAAVIGMNPYKSAYELWAEKTDKIAPFEGNMTTRVGAYLEDFVAKLFEEEREKKVRRNNFTLVNEDYPFACANVDREVVGENAFLEIKTSNSVPILRQLRGTEFPDAYYTQCVHYMAVGNYDKCYLAVLAESRHFHIYEMSRDQLEIDALMSAERDFWTCVETNQAPMIDGSDSTAETIAAIYPDSTDDCVDLAFFRQDLDEISAYKAQKKVLDGLISERENRIKEFMKEAGKGKCDGYTVSFGTQTKVSFDDKAYRADHKDTDFSQYLKTSSFRSFRITEKKGDK